MSKLSKELQLRLYKDLVLARRMEDALCKAFAEGKIPAWVHSRMGQEAIGVAASACMQEKDYFVPYLNHFYIIGKGVSLKEYFAELFAKKTGINGGKAGEIHLHSPKHRIFGGNGFVGDSFSVTPGLGYACKTRNQGEVVFCQFGDGSTNRGSFHEALNMVSAWGLPVVYICENNDYSVFTPRRKAMNIENISDRAKAYGIPGITVDGNDILAVYDVINEAAIQARAGKGPSLIEAKTYRQHGHFEGDPCLYRTKEEMAEWLKKDPLPRYEQYLLKNKLIDQDYITKIDQDVRADLDRAIDFAIKSPVPTREDILTGVYEG